jgi:hypothetical protein
MKVQREYGTYGKNGTYGRSDDFPSVPYSLSPLTATKSVRTKKAEN